MGDQIIIMNSLEAYSFIWYITIINKILFEACAGWIYDECRIAPRADTRFNAILGCPYILVLNGYCIPIFFSVSKWNRFQDTSRLQKKLVWFSCVCGGGECRCGACSP